MPRLHSLCGAVAVAALTLVPVTTFAQEGGPCTDDIAKLKRSLGTQVGLGAPVSEPDYGQRQGPNDKAAQKNAANTTGTVGSSETDRAQPGGAPREAGGSPGTVGGVAGPVGAATGSTQADAVASGRVATSPEDVRRQSENRPTTAAAAAQDGGQSTAGGPSTEDKVSQAKMALQRAVDLNAKGDQGCRDAVQQTQKLMPQQPGR
ncbi:hypothetical protein [Methylobacterium soli]|uniref:Uncharacterized protein n=1 Tax=Methylobacterium soli TaxID=553447 RepID=A0A6L3ST77_9HYPH|nr:hypothetical protein [Methylobacterium soli]KAB1075962.1 hypothetical protein F6X53_24355 [Methylobacterium soli]GJE45979.1 hypothetical protein AEGHOMDF_5179 [Methylobacterium soli]